MSIKELEYSTPTPEKLYDQAFDLTHEISSLDALRYRQAGVTSYLKQRKFSLAAQKEEDIGKLYENRLDDPDKALEAYQLAEKWYRSERKIT